VTSKSIALVALGGVCAALTACGGGAPPSPAPPKSTATAAAPAAAPVAAAKPGQPGALVPAAPAVPASDAPKYDNKGRKDPFSEVQLVTSAGGLTVSSTRLTGIVRSPRAVLALLETPDGIGYILKPGDTLGDGRLLEIGADNVVFTVGPKPGAPATRVVLRLAAN
jgi:hypothetical protein